MTGVPAIDIAVLDALTAQFGESDVVMRRTILETYLQEGAKWMAEFRTAVDRNDTETVRCLAYRLKSSSAVLGMLPLAARLQQTEDAARADVPNVALATLAEAEFARAAAAIAEQLGTLSTPGPPIQAGTR